jgi:hypothetical protein
MTTFKKTSRLAVAGLLVLTAALPALARGRSEHAHARAGLARTLHAHGLLGQLIFPCPAACGAEAKSCLDGADAAALTCISDSCPTAVDAAQSTCSADRSSTDCHDAIVALAACGVDCLDTRASAVSDCRRTQMECRDACSDDQ